MLYRCKDIPEDNQTVEKFGFLNKEEREAARPLQLPKSVVLELRAGRGYTVFPPSVVPIEDENGSVISHECLVWGDGASPEVIESIPEISWRELRKRGGELAFLSVALRVYPREEGGRDDFCHKLAGALLDIGWSPDEAEGIIETLAGLAGDSEQNARRGKAERKVERIEKNQPIPTLHTFLDHVGLSRVEDRVRSWLQLPKREYKRRLERPADAIDVDSHELHLKVQQVGELLRTKSKNVYKRGGKLVRLYALEALEHIVRHVDGREVVIRSRPAGLFEIREATPGWMAIEASRVGGTFWRRNRLVEPPTELFNRIRDYTDSLDLPALRGITMTPTLERDQPGYDPDYGVFHAYPAGLFPPIPANPTRADAEAALSRLLRTLREFPFLDSSSKAVAVSGIVSGVLRAGLPGAPIHVIDAPSAGTGKTLLAKIIGVIATGVLPTILTYTGDEEEDRKQLSVALMAGSPVILLDNISKPLRGDFIAGVVTSPEFEVRILGRSENVKIDTRSLILGSGNNTIVQGDLGRRTVRCRLDANQERPEEREFDFDPLVEARESRAQLVIDALTIVRAYQLAGRASRVAPLGSFEDWSRLVREPLIWLGLEDPAGTRREFEDFDPERETKMKLVQALLKAFGTDRWFKLAEFDGAIGEMEAAKNALTALLYDNTWSTRALGRLLSRHRDAPLLGVAIRVRPDRRASVMEYRLDGQPMPELLQNAAPPAVVDDGIPF